MTAALAVLLALLPAAPPAPDAAAAPMPLVLGLPLPPPPPVETDPPFWARAEALAWWLQGAHVPVLATSSPAGTSQANAGVPFTRGVRPVLGNERVNNGARFGGRFEVGTWLGPDF